MTFWSSRLDQSLGGAWKDFSSTNDSLYVSLSRMALSLNVNPIFCLSLSHSETILTGLEITSWAWPGSPKMCWLRSLTSSCPTWGPGGLNHRQLHLLTHHRGNPSKLRYEKSRCGKHGFGSWIPHTEDFHFPKAALHALLSWSTVANLVFRNVCVGQESDTFQHRKNQWKFTSTVNHSS